MEQLQTFFGQYLPQLLISACAPFAIFAFMMWWDVPVATVEAFPPSLLTDEPEGWFTGEAPFTGGSVADRAAPERTGRPRIAVTTSSFPDFSLTAMRAQVGVTDLLPGLAEGVQLLKPGGKGLIYVPAALSYGDGDWPKDVPRGMPIGFFVELHEVLAQ